MLGLQGKKGKGVLCWLVNVGQVTECAESGDGHLPGCPRVTPTTQTHIFVWQKIYQISQNNIQIVRTTDRFAGHKQHKPIYSVRNRLYYSICWKTNM